MKFNLDTIGDEKLEEIRAIKEKRGLISAIEKARERGLNPVISEIKKKSPSRGKIRELDPVKTAKQMEKCGACAISVLTDKHFNGSLCDLRRVKEAVKIPVLRKDFIVDEFQIYQSHGAGADAVLLIVALLGEKTRDFVKKTHELGMEALVEVHSEGDLTFALDSGAQLIGVNNRDLRTLKIDLGTTEILAKKIPEDRMIVAESGINSRKDLDRMLEAGADAALIGTGIMQAENMQEKLRGLTGK